ncbi:MAG: Ppx/GppA family phosphatase [Beijerinckiaceae bacterium]|nr:Ppx/GppA family phosphatase [Beijerinckiaceae bacterium]
MAVIDIGSNSVRLVVYEGLARTPTPIFNEKVLAGLGRNIVSNGHLPLNGVKEALSALRRFRVLCETMKVGTLKVLATAAARDATNGQEFLHQAEAILGTGPIELISGAREAQLSAYGVVSGLNAVDGIVGDMGGGSLELVEVRQSQPGESVSLRLGGLALQDTSGNSLKKARPIVKAAFEGATLLGKGHGRSFYAVGGTWRALAKLHMHQTSYPLNVMHGYTVPAREMLDFCRMIQRVSTDTISGIASVASARRPLLVYGALLLENIVLRSKVKQVVLSAYGVREGLIYEMLDDGVKASDPLISAASELNQLFSRSPRHGFELAEWCDRIFESSHLEEKSDERRLRLAACLMSDLSWRAHPDYRADQSLSMIAHASLAGVDHPGRTFLALCAYYRHIGSHDIESGPHLRELAGSHLLEHARILGAAMRVAYILSAAMPGVLGRLPIVCEGKKLVLKVPLSFENLANDRVFNRMKQLAKLLGREPQVSIQ